MYEIDLGRKAFPSEIVVGVALRGHPFFKNMLYPKGVATEGHPYNDFVEIRYGHTW